MNLQGNLFGDTLMESSKKQNASKTEKLTLSFSKAQILDQCNRRYYYQYYGSDKRRKNIKESNKEMLWKLKKLSNRYTLFGKIIHDTIEIFYKKSKQGVEWEIEQMLWLAKKKLKESIEYSKSYKIGQIDKMKYALTPLKEIVLMGMDADKIENDGIILIEKCFSNLSDAPELKHYYWEEYIFETAIIEKKILFDLTPNIRINGQIDFAHYDENKEFFNIVDWKTGELDFEDTSLQLLVYAIWANQELEIPLDKIRIYKAYLKEGKLDRLRLDNYEIDRAKTKILQDFATKIRLLHPKGINAKVGAFEPRKEENICSLCPFEDICYPENNSL